MQIDLDNLIKNTYIHMLKWAQFMARYSTQLKFSFVTFRRTWAISFSLIEFHLATYDSLIVDIWLFDCKIKLYF